MREIKFRIWDGERMHCADGPAVQVQDGEFAEDIEYINAGSPAGEWLQFTGVRDVKDRDVYEHDIVSYEGMVGVVRWSMAECGWVVQTSLQTEGRRLAYFQLEHNMVEVVGNRHENVELLDPIRPTPFA